MGEEERQIICYFNDGIMKAENEDYQRLIE